MTDQVPTRLAAGPQVSPARTVADLAIVTLVIAAVIGIRAGAPSNTYAYAQVWQVGVAIDVGENGNWLTPHDQKGAPARKPQLLPWLTGPMLASLGVYNDFTFRLPSLAAAMLTGALVYCLGRRWCNRRVALLAGCLWATAVHMGRLSYLATTDMMLTLWITAAVACVDRVLWHRAARRRWLWLVGFYASMILAALSKGWGVVNWPVLALMVALVAAMQASPGGVLRRWWQAIKGIGLWWGLLAFAVVLGGLMMAMNAAAGNDLSNVLGFEVFQRITGAGDSPPKPTSVPPILQMIYFTLPMSIMAIGAFWLERPKGLFAERRWLTGLTVAGAVGWTGIGLWLIGLEVGVLKAVGTVMLFIGAGLLVVGLSGWCRQGGALALPTCWLLAVVVPFSLAHGFRPDYLLPCYAAVAIMAAWAVDRVAQLGVAGGRLASTLRHVFAAAPVLIACLLIVTPLLYLLGASLPAWMQPAQPYSVSAVDRAVLLGLIPAGAIMLAAAIALSLKWKVRQLALLACAGMLGVIFIEGNFISRHARTGDGDKMVAFARSVRETIGQDDFLVLLADKLTVELHLGRFGEVVVGTKEVGYLERINASTAPWLITCDRGLVHVGAADESPDGPYRIKLTGMNRWFITKPRDLGETAVRGGALHEYNRGSMYLIRLYRPVTVSGKPVDTGYISGDWDDED